MRTDSEKHIDFALTSPFSATSERADFTCAKVREVAHDASVRAVAFYERTNFGFIKKMN